MGSPRARSTIPRSISFGHKERGAEGGSGGLGAVATPASGGAGMHNTPTGQNSAIGVCRGAWLYQDSDQISSE